MIDLSEFFYRFKTLPMITRLILFGLVAILLFVLLLRPVLSMLLSPAASPVQLGASPTTAGASPTSTARLLPPQGTGRELSPTPVPSLPRRTPTVPPTPLAPASSHPSGLPPLTPLPQATPPMPVTPPTVTITPVPTPVDPQALYTAVTSRTPIYTTRLATNDEKQWDVGAFSGGSCRFTGGAYQITIAQPGYAGVCATNTLTITNFAFQATMTLLGGDSGGLVFRDAHQHLYAFRISTDGTYDVTSQTDILASGQSQAILTGLGQTNQLTVIAQEQQISLYVNHVFITTVTDPLSNSGSIGCLAVDVSAATTVTFSTVQLWTL